MTAPMNLPLIGQIKVREISKESLMELWVGVLCKSTLTDRFSERMEEIKQQAGGFEVRTTVGTYRTNSVLLAIGRRGVRANWVSPGENLQSSCIS